MALYVDGQSVPTEPIQCEYKKGDFVTAYLTMRSALRKFRSPEDEDISLTDYANGYTFYVFDIDQRREREYGGLLKKGHTSRTETITALVYAQFPSMLQIDEARNVIL